MRANDRAENELRPIRIVRHYTCHAEGAVLVECGATWVLCTASVEERVPPFLNGKGHGWVTAEYGMLPRATATRTPRDLAIARPNGRSHEIQRLIGRSLRAAVDLAALGERTITIDCDVLQADGGTRTAAITGGYVALADALAGLRTAPLRSAVAAISVGVVDGIPLLDLDYREDSRAETDMNVVMNDRGEFIEIQGTAEKRALHRTELDVLLDLAAAGISQIFSIQRAAQ